jgi:hypothetical protein
VADEEILLPPDLDPPAALARIALPERSIREAGEGRVVPELRERWLGEEQADRLVVTVVEVHAQRLGGGVEVLAAERAALVGGEA